jgi:Homeodomain-like domain-containing protein
LQFWLQDVSDFPFRPLIGLRAAGQLDDLYRAAWPQLRGYIHTCLSAWAVSIQHENHLAEPTEESAVLRFIDRVSHQSHHGWDACLVHFQAIEKTFTITAEVSSVAAARCMLNRISDFANPGGTRNLPASVAMRMRMVLMLDEGASYHDIQEKLDTTAPTISLWKRRYRQDGIVGLATFHPGHPPRS